MNSSTVVSEDKITVVTGDVSESNGSLGGGFRRTAFKFMLFKGAMLCIASSLGLIYFLGLGPKMSAPAVASILGDVPRQIGVASHDIIGPMTVKYLRLPT